MHSAETYKSLKLFDNDDECRLGFVLYALASGAITTSEFSSWCLKRIEREDDIHWIFFDLLDAQNPDSQLFRDNNLRPPYVELSSEQSHALSGIRHLRNLSGNQTGAYEDSPNIQKKGLASLKANLEILVVFNWEFEGVASAQV